MSINATLWKVKLLWNSNENKILLLHQSVSQQPTTQLWKKGTPDQSGQSRSGLALVIPFVDFKSYQVIQVFYVINQLFFLLQKIFAFLKVLKDFLQGQKAHLSNQKCQLCTKCIIVSKRLWVKLSNLTFSWRDSRMDLIQFQALLGVNSIWWQSQF